MKEVPTFNFGKIEAVLAKFHSIADDKRTAFQSRLKNLHRLGFPAGFESRKGKASEYNAAAFAQMALAVELTQLGLSPESIVRILSENQAVIGGAWAIAAKQFADWSLAAEQQGDDAPPPRDVFIFFDPQALASLVPMTPGEPAGRTPEMAASETFWFGYIGMLEYLTQRRGRLAVVDLTNILHLMTRLYSGDDGNPLPALHQLALWTKQTGYSEDQMNYFNAKLEDIMNVELDWFKEHILPTPASTKEESNVG